MPYSIGAMPWSQSFVKWVIKKAGGKAPKTNYVLEYWAWAQKNKLTSRTAKPGYVAVTDWFSGIVTRSNANYVWVIGGNVEDSVKATALKRSWVIGFIRGS